MLLRREGGFLRRVGGFLRRGGVLKKARVARGAGDGPLLQKGGWLLEKGGGVLKNPVEALTKFDPFPPTMFCQTCALPPAVFYENDGNHENNEDISDSDGQGVECWASGNHGNHGHDE